MKTLLPQQRKFIKETTRLAKSYGVEVFLSKQRSVKLPGGGRSNGYFCDEFKPSPRLAVGTNQASILWFSVFLHESSHMDQWREKSVYWEYSSEGDSDIYARWLGKGRFQKPQDIKKARQVIDKFILLEADCEIRSAKKIKNLNLELDYAEYCQKANAYIYFYQAMKYTRNWYDIGREPYAIDAIVQAMPRKMLKRPEDYLKMPRHLLDLYFMYYPRKI